MEIHGIGIIGASTMGQGIAQIIAMNGDYSVILHDIEQRSLERGLSALQDNLRKLVLKEKITAEKQKDCLDRITSTVHIEELKNADLVIEAAVEKEEVKAGIFQRLDTLCKENTIFASNTSSLSITRLASCTKRQSRFMGMHFFNPVPAMRLVEIVRGMHTCDETVNQVSGFISKLGKIPIEVKDSTGFVVNRILIPFINEAVYVLQEGVASAESIDEAMKLGANHPLGPLALADLIGLDVCLHIMTIFHKDLGEDKYRPCPLLRKYVDAGLLGRKTGRGFYLYE